MNKKVRDKQLTKLEIAYLAHHTGQWWNGIFVQAERFFNAEKNNKGEFPWEQDGTNNLFLIEQLF